MDTNNTRRETPETPGSLLSAHAAIVLLTALFVGVIVGALTAYSARDAGSTMLAGLTSFGVSAPALHKLIGN